MKRPAHHNKQLIYEQSREEFATFFLFDADALLVAIVRVEKQTKKLCNKTDS
jgi:hypothetical protein